MFLQKENVNLVFIEFNEYKKNENSNPIYFVTVGNPLKFEQYTYMAQRELLPKLQQLGQGEKVVLELASSNYNGRTSDMLVDINPKK